MGEGGRGKKGGKDRDRVGETRRGGGRRWRREKETDRQRQRQTDREEKEREEGGRERERAQPEYNVLSPAVTVTPKRTETVISQHIPCRAAKYIKVRYKT